MRGLGQRFRKGMTAIVVSLLLFIVLTFLIAAVGSRDVPAALVVIFAIWLWAIVAWIVVPPLIAYVIREVRRYL